jgi:hypothetical protein
MVSADEFEDQPDSKHSNICCNPTPDPKDAESIVDANFAKELHDALGDNGFHSMVITFAECFGGGMMDDVADKFAASTKPISMTSGSKHDERAGSKPSTGAGGKNDGCSRWGQAYREVHPGKTGNVNNNPKESDAYNNAKNAQVWKDSNPKRTAQQKTLNNGGNIKLGDGTGGSGATTYHAILFAGNTAGRDNYWNNIARQHKMLTDSGYPAANIETLYGDGNVPPNAVEPAGGIVPKAATRQNLINAIKALKGKMNENEQLYIFITDHGSPDKGTDTLPKPKIVSPQGHKDSNNTFEFSPLSAYLIEALQSPHNTLGPYIELNVKTSGIITLNWEVFFNDNAWAVNGGDNTFPGGGDETALRFPIGHDAISLTGDNDVWLRNSQSTDDPIEVEIYFSMGDIETYDEPVPVGGHSVLIDISVGTFGLWVPYISLALTILVAIVATAIYVKHVKRRKEKR